MQIANACGFVKPRIKLDVEEVLCRLELSVEPKKTFRMQAFSSNKSKPYEGTINGNSFNISRIIAYRNSFLPRISGVVEKGAHGTKVQVKMRLHAFVIAFMTFWFGMVGLACGFVILSLFGEGGFGSMLLIPFGMLAFGYALVMGAFKFESAKTKDFLAKLFGTQVDE